MSKHVLSSDINKEWQMYLRHKEVIKPVKLKFHAELGNEWFWNENNIPELMEHDLKAEQELDFERSDKRRYN